jgi:hypothetical protein
MSRVKTLTAEERQTLQVDAALRLQADNTQVLADLNDEIGQAMIEFGQAKLKLDRLREEKRTVIEIQKSLAMIIKHA